MKLQSTDFVILFVGRLHYQKGILHLIKAFNSLTENHDSNLKLIVIGEGPLRDTIENDIKKTDTNKITLLGYLDHIEVNHCYNLADILVLPSFNEQSSYVMLETIKNNIPIIVTDIDAFNDLEHEISCLKVPVKMNNMRIDVLAENIERLKNNSTLRKNIVKNAFSLFKNKLTSKQMFNATYSFQQMNKCP